MSRVGNKPIAIPSGVEVKVANGNEVSIKGPKGALSQLVDTELTVQVDNGYLSVVRPTDQKRHKALHGLYRSLLNNGIVGVSEGYTKQLELVGVGYKASTQGNVLELSLGYSHVIFFQVPSEIKVSTKTDKGKSPIIILEGIDKQLIGQIAAKIKSLRKVEPYKGKGIRFVGEVIRRKVGKAAAK